MENICRVHFILRKDKKLKDGRYPLNLLVTLNGKTFRLNVKDQRFFLHEWNFKNRKLSSSCKNNSLKWNQLKKESDKIEEFVLDCSRNNKRIGKEDVRNFYYGKGVYQEDFYTHFDNFIEKKFTNIAETTKKQYKLLRKQLKEKHPELSLTELNYTFFDDFFHYLKVEKATGNSGLATRRKNLITVLNQFVKKELIRKNYCIDIPRFPEKQSDVFLSLTEVDKLRNADLESGKKTDGLMYSRELFLFGCYTGLRFSDIMQLSWKNIHEGYISKIQQKTKRKVDTPLFSEALEILKKYKRGSKEGKIFPYRANAHVNRDLKEIAAKAGIDKHITFHTSRHTFGSNLAQQNISPFHIAHSMGHSDVRMTSRYVNSNAEILSNVMKSVSFRI